MFEDREGCVPIIYSDDYQQKKEEDNNKIIIKKNLLETYLPTRWFSKKSNQTTFKGIISK